MFGSIKLKDILKGISNLENVDKWRKKLIFLSLFIYTNKLQTACDKLDDNISLKQWILIIVTIQFEYFPTLSQLSDVLGCSRQNVKKLALALKKKGYLNLIRAENDARALTVKLTNKSIKYLENTDAIQKETLDIIYKKLNEEEIKELFNLLCKIYDGIEELEESVK